MHYTAMAERVVAEASFSLMILFEKITRLARQNRHVHNLSVQ